MNTGDVIESDNRIWLTIQPDRIFISPYFRVVNCYSLVANLLLQRFFIGSIKLRQRNKVSRQRIHDLKVSHAFGVLKTNNFQCFNDPKNINFRIFAHRVDRL